ncbi:MAG: 4-hydroxy-3-methylbut-2-enyl diphosphate reductase [Armatimonadetes bacterium]|jgi:4-hydroxy-3-methylbut-2-enyl diphosphate reductase|nr:4-hydroxy-3-methylbut-2-enyl diphosphate reductase [Armatimonadota bacterium]
MRVYLAKEVGFCFGVKRAINMTRQALAEYNDVSILGDVVHNRAVTSELEARGLVKKNALDEVKGGTMVIRAHGLPQTEIQAASARGLNIVDATCPIVTQAQDAARELERRGCTVIIIGDRNHAEIKGVMGNLENQAVVVDSVEELRAAKLDKRLLRKVGVIFQTTHSFELCSTIVNELITMAKEVQVINTICRPVRNRQMDAVELAERVDVMVVVGSRSSANTIELKHLCHKYNHNTIHVENADELDPKAFDGVSEVGIASGLSTPPEIVEAVKKRIMTWDQNGVELPVLA